MSVQTLAPAPLNDGLPACPDWCQLCRPVAAFIAHGTTFGPSRLHGATLLDGAIKVTVERYDEVDDIDDVAVVLAIGGARIELTPRRRANLRAVLDRLDQIAAAR